jgi:microcystin degradation protein MlrC
MPFKVLTAEMSHETNSFSRQETDEQAFRNRYVLMVPKPSPSAARQIPNLLAS